MHQRAFSAPGGACDQYLFPLIDFKVDTVQSLLLLSIVLKTEIIELYYRGTDYSSSLREPLEGLAFAYAKQSRLPMIRVVTKLPIPATSPCAMSFSVGSL